jgi:hypothetical protein
MVALFLLLETEDDHGIENCGRAFTMRQTRTVALIVGLLHGESLSIAISCHQAEADLPKQDGQVLLAGPRPGHRASSLDTRAEVH